MDCDPWDAIGAAGNYLLPPTPGKGGKDPDLAAVRRMFVQLGQAEKLPGVRTCLCPGWSNLVCNVYLIYSDMKNYMYKYGKTLLTAASIDQAKRAQLLRPFVLSILEYNLGTLVGMRESDYRYIATSVLQTYKAILLGDYKGHDKDD